MRKGFIGLVVVMVSMALLSLAAPKAEADNPVSFDITVNVVHTLSIEYDPADVTAYATLVATIGVTAVQTSGGITMINNGSGVAETYSLNLTEPSGWTSSTTVAGPETYVLNAAFDANGTGISWLAANHALTTSPVASSGTKFAGADQTGLNVPFDAMRDLWFQLVLPTSTTETATQIIPITITAGF